MGVILDLSVFKDETADIRMADGTVLHLKKPTERMVIHMLQMKDLDENKPPLEILAQLNRISWEMLNNNADGVEFSVAAVSEMATEVKSNILMAYSDWATQLQANPISPRPESPARAETKKRNWRSRLMPWRNTRA